VAAGASGGSPAFPRCVGGLLQATEGLLRPRPLRRGRFFFQGSRDPYGAAVWALPWVPEGAGAAVGDAVYARGADARGIVLHHVDLSG